MNDRLNIYDELVAVIHALDVAKVEYAICGGIALAVYGYPRLTRDIDLLVKRKDVPRIKEAVGKVGFILQASPMTFRKGTDQETRVHRVSKALGEDLLMLDLIEVEPSLRDVWKARRKMDFLKTKVRTVSREGLIRMKQRAGRPQDLADLVKLEGRDDETAGS